MFALGGLLAAIAVGLIVWRPWRLSPDDGATPSSSVTVMRPVDLPGLGYLSAETEAILLIQLPALLEKFDPAERDDPVRALTRLGLPEALVQTIDSASGVGLKNVEQIVLGLSFEKGSLPPQAVLVIRTRQTFNVPELVQATKSRALKKDGRTLHALKAGPVGDIFWWAPDERTLVATLLSRDFESVPGQALSGIAHLKRPLQDLLRTRLADDACVGLVATSDKWDELIRPYTIFPFTPLQGRRDLLKPAGELRSVALSIPHAADGRSEIAITLKSDAVGERLRATLVERFAGEPVDVSGEAELCQIKGPAELGRIGTIVERLVGR